MHNPTLQGKSSMTWIRTIPDDEAAGSLKPQYEAAIRRAGRVFGIVRAMSLNPGVLRSSMALYKSTMMEPSPLSRSQRELLATVVSKINLCHY